MDVNERLTGYLSILVSYHESELKKTPCYFAFFFPSTLLLAKQTQQYLVLFYHLVVSCGPLCGARVRDFKIKNRTHQDAGS